MKPAVIIEHLYVAYGKRLVLQDLSFQIDDGGFFIIIGPNSSGKTTLLKTMAGVVRPQQGYVEILGNPLASYAKRTLAQQVAVVPQYTPTDVPFTVQEVVLMGRSPHLSLAGLEQKRDLAIAQEAMEITKVAHLAGRRLDQLSGGELQRVVLARALCQQPRLIMLDEPTASLDLAHQVNIMDLLERLQQERGLTVIMISHDVNLAAMYGNQLLLMKEGRIVSLGPPREVLTYAQLEQAYGCVLLVDDNPVRDVPRVTLVPKKMLHSFF
ncbi:MAG: ABC transporter ATP-binding protein [Deltaproteobacteria bacterium]|nr:ABC transporter ATP-binding protein [Deltaproteobacteria bacterium]MBW1987230.1 ABC transporter ATP-binding protein [Deltaproteobacteria bacterium]MBW2134289.1 ABC transporter ATP-binding protein [Deltaproteobacteria bacterium]